MRYELHLGDNREVLRSMPSDSVDSIVSDPPYELGFMGKRWDSTGIAYDVTLWAECLRVLKPGGHLLAFGGSRTYHRLAVAIEDAGFEIRDCIMWLYASGFPKSHNLDGEHQGWGTALKPAHEPIVVARKPLQGTVADNVQAWGVGALNIDGCRVEYDGEPPKGSGSDNNLIYGHRAGNGGNITSSLGRWPANIILDEEAAQMLDEQSGWSESRGHVRHNTGTPSVAKGKEYPRIFIGHSDSGGASRFFYVAKASKAEREAGLDSTCTVKYNIDRSILGGLSWNDVGMATVQLLQKVTSELETLKWHIGESGESITVLYPKDSSFITSMEISKITALKTCNLLMHLLTSESTVDVNYEMEYGSSLAKNAEQLKAWILNITNGKMELARGVVSVALITLQKISESEPNARNNHHSTVKPIALMRYLVRMVTPRGGVVLDPFMGSGTTGCAAMLEGMNFIGIDITPEYKDIAERRIQYWASQNPMGL